MKNLILGLILLFIGLFQINSSGQKTTTIKSKQKYFTETYDVLQKDKEIKHGKYKKEVRKNRVVATGTFENNEKTGIWTYYNHKSEVIQRYDYTKKVLMFYKIEPEYVESYQMVNDNGLADEKLDRPPLYLGGPSLLAMQLAQKINYPRKAANSGISGTVIISFIIEQNGKTSNHTIEKRIGGGCDEEGLRVVKLMENNWIPGLYQGMPTRVKFFLPINFIL